MPQKHNFTYNITHSSTASQNSITSSGQHGGWFRVRTHLCPLLVRHGEVIVSQEERPHLPPQGGVHAPDIHPPHELLFIVGLPRKRDHNKLSQGPSHEAVRESRLVVYVNLWFDRG